MKKYKAAQKYGQTTHEGDAMDLSDDFDCLLPESDKTENLTWSAMESDTFIYEQHNLVQQTDLTADLAGFDSEPVSLPSVSVHLPTTFSMNFPPNKW